MGRAVGAADIWLGVLTFHIAWGSGACRFKAAYRTGAADWTQTECEVIEARSRLCRPDRSPSAGTQPLLPSAPQVDPKETLADDTHDIMVEVKGDFRINGRAAFPGNMTIVAYPQTQDTDCAFETESEARQELTKYSEGDAIACYVNLEDMNQVRLTPGNNPEIIPKLRFLAIVSTALAVLSAIFVVFMLRALYKQLKRIGCMSNVKDEPDGGFNAA